MRAPKFDSTNALIILATFVVVVLMSVLMASVQSSRSVADAVLLEVQAQSEANGQEVHAHRIANQTAHDADRADNDCIVALILLVVDPQRDRTREVTPPDICRQSPAHEHAKNGGTP